MKILRVMALICALSPALSCSAFLIDYGVAESSCITIYYTGCASIRYNQSPKLQSGVLIFDVTNLTEDTTLMEPTFNISITWQSNEIEDIIINDELWNADMLYTHYAWSDIAMATVSVNNAIPGHHYVVEVISADDEGSYGYYYTNGLEAYESGILSSIDWGFH